MLLLAAGWLAPGSGFFLLDRRHWRRGVIFLVVIHLTFFLGICLKGGLVWPAWTLWDPAFSIVNNLSLLMQLGAGWMAVLSLLAHLCQWPLFAASEPHALFELGSFYCLVAGGLNYFVVLQSLDLSRKKAFELLAKE